MSTPYDSPICIVCGTYSTTVTCAQCTPAPASAPEPEGISRALRYLAELARMIERAPEDSINAHWHAQDAKRAHEAYDAVIALRARVAELEADSFDLDAFSAENRSRCEAAHGFNHALNSWSLSDWMTATLGELGEAANVAKKLNRIRDGITGNKETEAELLSKLESEIADAFIYLDLMAQSQGFSLSKAVRRTFDAKSQQIGYATAARERGV